MDLKTEHSNEPLIEGSTIPARWDQSTRHRNSRLSSPVVCITLLATNILTLIGGIGIYMRSHWQSTDVYRDPWFGTIPYKDVLWEIDDRFVDTNPKVFYNETGADEHSAWSEIYPSGWVALTSSPAHKLEGGALLSMWGSEEEHWEEGTQAWATTLMHQIHCLGTVKSAFHKLQQGEVLDEERSGHVPHCIEYFRQSFLCQADLTLEPPMDVMRWPQGTSGWGNTHRCRDWDTVLEALKEHSILREGGRWVRLRPEH